MRDFSFRFHVETNETFRLICLFRIIRLYLRDN